MGDVQLGRGTFSGVWIPDDDSQSCFTFEVPGYLDVKMSREGDTEWDTFYPGYGKYIPGPQEYDFHVRATGELTIKQEDK